MAAEEHNILLAEDNPVNRKVMGHMLAKLGHAVDFVENGLQAVEAASRKDYDLIFMDMMMPVMDGISAARAIREREDGVRHTPIVAVTANVEPNDERNCADAGMDGFIRKPFTIDQLRECAERYTRNAFTSEDPQSLNRSVLAAFIETIGDGDMDFVREVLTDLMSEASRTRSDLHAALFAEDAPGVRRAAHSLKSAAAVVGAEELSSICQRMESAGKNEQLADVSLMMSPFEGAINALRDDIEAFVAERLAS